MDLDEKLIKKGQRQLVKLSKEIKNKSALHQIASDPTRLKIIFLLKKNPKLCVSELATILNITISAVSHQLSLLGSYHIVQSEKMGQTVCYYLDKKFKTDLFNIK